MTTTTQHASAVLIAGMVFGIGIAGAQSLPKSGTISFHTGFKYTAEVVTPADKTMIGRGNSTGATFNDNGSGPLHLGPANCSEGFFMQDGKGKDYGYCAFGDADGDRVFTQYWGTLGPDGANGTNEIIGGTGKYAGITGSGPWKCKMAGANGELQCAQKLDYKLP